ncbi:MAG: hypothetical protein A2020_12290 [Lentisphaerae bacterium GWF2_45_14]|nr:MAG: hypothetical protein A2020_12290 [Lentisphaerae bacterium GWF2_45_14]
MMKIYVASSWRNALQPIAVGALRKAGHEVYDFRHPALGNYGFKWSEIDPDWQKWNNKQYKAALNHDIAQAGYDSDFAAMQWADAFVGVMPFGRSASMEMGWAAGNKKLTIFYLIEHMEPELMVKMFDHICCSMDEVIEALKEAEFPKLSTSSHPIIPREF